MKTVKLSGLAMALAAVVFCGETALAQAPGTAPAPQVSPAAAEVVKLASSGVGDDVVVAYIRNSQSAFDLNADQLLYLKDVGLSQQVITAMLDHDNALKGQAPGAPAPAPAPELQPQSQQYQQYAPQPQQGAPAGPTSYFQPASAPEAAPAPQPSMPVQAPPPGPAATATPPPAYVGSAPLEVSYFYNDLSPYGSWVSLAGVGWCWQPSAVVVTPGWRPYCNGGHWVWTDAGWFWQSDYSWGWAPFHYGRWYLDTKCGWVWLPGTTWGPAWVTWRSVGTTCGWAPLPPRADFVAGVGWRYNGVAVGATFDFGLGVNAFAFVSFGNFCAGNVSTYCLPRSQVTVIYKQTTVINNYVVNNNTFINRGIAFDRISAASKFPVQRATVRETSVGGRPVAGGGAFVYREPLHTPAKPVNMVAQKVDVGHTIQHTSVNTLRYEPKATGNGSTTTYFQHNTQNTTVKNQQNATFNNHPQGQTQNFERNQNQTGKNYQSYNPEKTTTNPQTTTGNKNVQTYERNQTTTTTTKQNQFSSTTGTGNRQELSRENEELGDKNHNSETTTGSKQQPYGQKQQNYYRFYNPKSGEQASEVHSLPKTATPSGTGNNSQNYNYNNSQQYKKNP